jgi:hypothetical protein
MKASEILGLRGENIFDEYIHVCAQHDEYGYRPTKTKKKRNIPLALMIINELRQLAAENNNGYVFSLDGGETPVTRKLMYNKFHKALQAIGMTQEEIKRRGLSMHSWRHFFNTTLQMANVALSKAVSPNDNPLKLEYSKDFLKVKEILEGHRTKIQVIQKELRIFRKVKKLVLEVKDEEPEKIHEVLPQIAALFPGNVDKNVQKRR